MKQCFISTLVIGSGRYKTMFYIYQAPKNCLVALLWHARSTIAGQLAFRSASAGWRAGQLIALAPATSLNLNKKNNYSANRRSIRKKNFSNLNHNERRKPLNIKKRKCQRRRNSDSINMTQNERPFLHSETGLENLMKVEKKLTVNSVAVNFELTNQT